MQGHHSSTALVASNIEFISIVEEFLAEGNITCNAELHNTYTNVCYFNGIDTSIKIRSGREFKAFIEEEIPGVEFSLPKRKNESERVCLKHTKDAAVAKLEQESYEDQFKTLHAAAMLIRKTTLNAKSWIFEGSMEPDRDHIPELLPVFFKWCLVGKRGVSSVAKPVNEIDARAIRLSQTLICECLSQDQVARTPDTGIKHRHEFPLQVSLGLSFHQLTRSSNLVNFLHSVGLSVHYSRIWDIENKIANSAIAKMNEHGRLYLPPDTVSGWFIPFAVDNTDFQEDTPDGRNALHGTVIAAYQTTEDGDASERLTLLSDDENISIPKNVYLMLSCSLPKGVKPSSPSMNVDVPTSDQPECLKAAVTQDIIWMLGGCLQLNETQRPNALLLTWSAHNSMVNEIKHKTNISDMQLLPASPPDTSVQYSLLKQLEKVSEKIRGPGKKTAVTAYLGFYKPLKHLQMAFSIENWVRIPGDLHIIMATLRTIGNYIESTGIPESWVESGLFGDITVRHLLEGEPVRRSCKAHITTLHAFFILLLKEFFKEDNILQEKCETVSLKLRETWQQNDAKAISMANKSVTEDIKNLQLYCKLKDFCEQKNKDSPTFKMVLNYMDMVFTLMAFIRAVRNADWELCLCALEDFNKYLFAMDLRNYSALCAWHLAEMKVLLEKDRETWLELASGKWAPNKSEIPFCSLGADEALEQENRRKKVQGGIVGIRQNTQTLNKLFLSSPELAKICSYGLAPRIMRKNEVQHEVSKAATTRHWKNVSFIVECFQKFINLFTYEGSDLINFVTMTIVPAEVAHDVCEMPYLVLEQYQKFVGQRIIDKTVNFWDTVPQNKLKLCKTMAKKVKFNTKEGVVELKEDRKLFNHLVVLCRSCPEINLKECIGKYELSSVPRSMFGSDGTMNHVHAKSKLMHHLENIVSTELSAEVTDWQSPDPVEYPQLVFSVAILDGMAEIHTLKLKKDTQTISDLAEQFYQKISSKYKHFSELHVVFDSYVENSLKNATRSRRQHGKPPIQYKIEAKTNIKSVPLKKLLSHVKNKDAITAFLSDSLINLATDLDKNVVVSYRQEAKATKQYVDNLRTSQEEAGMKIILHALNAAERGAQSLRIFTPDTDVLVLTIHYYPQLPKDTSFVLTGIKKREICLAKVYGALGENRAEALLGMHSLSGDDITGSFSGKSKTSFWNKFLDADDKVLEALASLGKTEVIKEETYQGLEEYICSVYLCAPKLKKLKELRWWFFTKKQAESVSMPPTQATLHPAIQRAYYQAMIWQQAHISSPSLPPVTDFGWVISENDCYVPVMCDLLSGPEELLSIFRCSCGPSKCVPPCKCVMNGFSCTEMCSCSANIEKCDNIADPDEQNGYEAADVDEEEEL